MSSQPQQREAPSADATVVETAAAPSPVVEQPSLLHALVTAAEPVSTTAPRRAESQRLEKFLREESTGAALREWLGGPFHGTKDALARRLNRDVATIDGLLNSQLNAIIHAPRFQRLEASWRGLQHLVDRVDDEGDPAIKVRALTISWREIARDFERAIEFDQSQLFRKVYESEFGTAGGEPFGVILADYEVHPRVAPDHPYDDVSIVESLSGVAAASFCPIILNANPSLFGLDDFERLEQRLDHDKTFEQPEYLKWRRLREKEDSRFIGLTMPRVLMRTPYEDGPSRTDRFRFEEDVSGPDRGKYLWGGATYAFGSVLVRAFAQAGWLADIRGLRRGVEGGGLVTDLPLHNFGVDAPGITLKSSTDVIITEQLEKQLSDLGFIPLCHAKDTPYAAFHSTQSLQKPQRFDRAAATMNARLSAMTQYMLCVSRFAHYVKVIARDKLGAFSEYEEFERLLQNWVVRYVTSDSEASPETKARFPLRDAQVKVEPNPGKPGSYRCQMHLMPHYELDDLQASVRVVAELAPSRAGGR